jgi:hypothetical protein
MVASSSSGSAKGETHLPVSFQQPQPLSSTSRAASVLSSLSNRSNDHGNKSDQPTPKAFQYDDGFRYRTVSFPTSTYTITKRILTSLT